MLTYYRSTPQRRRIQPREKNARGNWVRVERPNEDEISQLLQLGMDEDIIRDALDPHEVPRVDQEDGWIYFITRLPDTDDDFNDFTTPILYAIGTHNLVTLSRDPLGRLWQPFIDKSLTATTRQTELLMVMLEALTNQYQRRVATINRQMRAATSDVTTLRSKDISVLAEYERKLNDYLDALIPTNSALEKLLGGKFLRLEDDMRELVEDLSIDMEQVIARCKSLLRTITNVRDSYRAVMDTRLNETIRLLTVITVALTIPTMLAGIYGMNVPLPFERSPVAFWWIIGLGALASTLMGYYFLKRRS